MIRQCLVSLCPAILNYCFSCFDNSRALHAFFANTAGTVLSTRLQIRGGHSKRFWAILTTIQSLLQLQKRFRIYSGSGRLERFWSESSLLQKRLRRSIWLQNRCFRFCFCLDEPSGAIHMQNRIENPFRAQRGGQTRSEFYASDSVQNQPRITPESKAESLTVTAPNIS